VWQHKADHEDNPNRARRFFTRCDERRFCARSPKPTHRHLGLRRRPGEGTGREDFVSVRGVAEGDADFHAGRTFHANSRRERCAEDRFEQPPHGHARGVRGGYLGRVADAHDRQAHGRRVHQHESERRRRARVGVEFLQEGEVGRAEGPGRAAPGVLHFPTGSLLQSRPTRWCRGRCR
jgi:hypothetical protein